MKDYGYKFTHKLPQSVTILNSRKNCSIELKPKDVQKSDFLTILCGKLKREFKKPNFKTGDTVGISENDLPFRKSYKSQFTQETFKIVAITTKKVLTYTKKMMMRLRFYVLNI